MNVDELHLIAELEVLTTKQRLCFAASICERLIPNYTAFSTMEHWGDPLVFRVSLNKVWEYLEQGSLSEADVKHVIEQCLDLVPDSDEFSTLFVAAAQNAASAIIYTLESCLDGDTKRIALVARLAVETIIDYSLRVNDPDTGIHGPNHRLEDWAEHSPLLLAEIEKQAFDIRSVKSREKVDSALLNELRSSSQRFGIQPFVRGMLKATRNKEG
jgi:uncharacterized protein YjaG (DUF416 family)